VFDSLATTSHLGVCRRRQTGRLHRHSGRTQIYVSRGAGFWGPPMRVGNPAEIPDIILT
jgi:predicted MPP superfamily phosphohydrolase